MKYDDRPTIDAAYVEIASLYEREDDPDRALASAGDLLKRGEVDSWASVWWAYGVLHHDLSDEGYARALEVLARVDRSRPARAAALMLTAEIESTQAIQGGGSPDASRQVELLGEAARLMPGWPSVRIRLAYPLRDLGEVSKAVDEAETALALIDGSAPTTDPFDGAITGLGLNRDYVASEVEGFAIRP